MKINIYDFYSWDKFRPINEAVITSYSTSKLIHRLKMLLRVEGAKLVTRDLSVENPKLKMVEVTVTGDDHSHGVRRLATEYAAAFGYFLSDLLIDGNREIPLNVKAFHDILDKTDFKSTTILVFEALYTEKVSPPSVMYHATFSRNMNSIMKEGLIPSTRSKLSFHPHRVYLSDDKNFSEFFSKDIQLLDSIRIESLIKKFVSKEMDLGKLEFFGNGDVTLLQVETSGLGMTLMEDPKCVDEDGVFGYFTYDRIPPEKLKVLKEIKGWTDFRQKAQFIKKTYKI